VAYINQQNLPVVVQPTNVQVQGDMVTLTANFPYNATLMNGLTIAAVTTKAQGFASADEVAAAALFGPGLIEVN